jgi:phosphoribosylformylglycinamidine cyclo-ligase
MPPGGFDLAGFCVGVAERADLWAEPAGRPGDALIGIAASGLHSNGFSLVRKVIAEKGLDLRAPFQGSEARSLGELLLTPTRIYAPDVLALRDHLDRRGLAVHGLAHITGGGLPGNIPRVLIEGAGARVDPHRWPVPPIVSAFAALAGLEPVEARAIFNGGIGMIAVVERRAVEPALNFLGARGLEAWLIGDVVEQTGDERYLEGPLS